MLFLSLMMIPNELVVITNFVTITDLDLRNSFPGLILPLVTSVFYTQLLSPEFQPGKGKGRQRHHHQHNGGGPQSEHYRVQKIPSQGHRGKYLPSPPCSTSTC